MKTPFDKRRVKVCILTSAHSPFDVRIFLKEARTLVRAGYEVTIIAPHSDDACAEGVAVKALPHPSRRLERFLAMGKMWRKALAENADVYHFHDPDLIFAGVLLKLSRKIVIYDAHEDVPEDVLTKRYLPKRVRPLVAWVANLLEKSCARRFDAVVTATGAIAEKFNGFKRVVVLRNFPLLSEFQGTLAERLPHQGFRCLYLGGLNEWRGITQAVETMQRLPDLSDAKLVLCGRFESAAFEDELRRHKGFEAVDFRGVVERSLVPGLLRKMDAGIVCFQPLPFCRVALPNKIFEYMAAALPVVASNFPLWREIIEGNSCGLCVDPEDPNDIAQAVRYLYGHPEERRKMGENGYRAVREKYNWEKEGEKLVALYKSLLEDKEV